MEFLETLGIDYRLLIAQIINFGILLFVLTKFAYRPILNVLEKRQERISKSLQSAKEMEERMKKFETEQQESQRRHQEHLDQMLAETRERAEALKASVVEQAKRDAEEVLAKARQDAEYVKMQTMAETRSHIAGMVVDAAEKIIRKKISDKDDHALIEEAIREVER